MLIGQKVLCGCSSGNSSSAGVDLVKCVCVCKCLVPVRSLQCQHSNSEGCDSFTVLFHT